MPPTNTAVTGRESVESTAVARQQFVLDYLRENDGEARLSELSYQLALHEAAGSDIEDNEILYSYVDLEYEQVPALERQGYVEYDSSEQAVSLRADAHDGPTLTRDAPPDEREWAIYYGILGTTLAGIVVVYELLSLSRPLFGGIVLVTAAALIWPPAHLHYHRR